MECTLIVPKKRVEIGESLVGEVVIRNTGDRDISFLYNTNPWEYLNLDVTDPAGKNITRRMYGERFSPSSPTPKRLLKLGPGESYKGPVNIFGTTDDADLRAKGVYRFKAIFEIHNDRVSSEQVPLEIGVK